MLILGIAVAGAIGAPTRYLLDGYVQSRSSGSQPLGTLLINTSGSFVLGVLVGLALYHGFGVDTEDDPRHRILRRLYDLFHLHLRDDSTRGGRRHTRRGAERPRERSPPRPRRRGRPRARHTLKRSELRDARTPRPRRPLRSWPRSSRHGQP